MTSVPFESTCSSYAEHTAFCSCVRVVTMQSVWQAVCYVGYVESALSRGLQEYRLFLILTLHDRGVEVLRRHAYIVCRSVHYVGGHCSKGGQCSFTTEDPGACLMPSVH